MLIMTLTCFFTLSVRCSFLFFFFNDTATTEIYTLSLHDALPICDIDLPFWRAYLACIAMYHGGSWLDTILNGSHRDRKSTRLNSSHDQISYAVFCLKKKKKKT